MQQSEEEKIEIANKCIDHARELTTDLFNKINSLPYTTEALGYIGMMVASSTIDTIQDHLSEEVMNDIDELMNMTRANKEHVDLTGEQDEILDNDKE